MRFPQSSAFTLRVTLWPSFCSISSPPAPVPPAPSPEDHRESYRVRCLVLYHEARIGGLDHNQSLREVARLLKLSGHPWSAPHVVAKEINEALGRRPGRTRRGTP